MTPWLAQSGNWAGQAVEAQMRSELSTLALRRRALKIRRASLVSGDGELVWADIAYRGAEDALVLPPDTCCWVSAT